MVEIQYSVRTNLTFELKELVKQQITQKNLAKRLRISRQQLNKILNDPGSTSIDRLVSILEVCGYKLELHVVKIE